MSSTEKLTFGDLDALDSSPAEVRESFKHHFNNVQPDGLALNDQTYYNAVHPPITEQYGHPCYKHLEQFQFEPEHKGDPEKSIVGIHEAVNNSDKEARISTSVTGSWSETRTWSTSVTTGMTFSASVEIKAIFSIGGEVSVSTTIGHSNSKTLNKSSTSSVEVDVPAHSKKKVKMVATLQKERLNFHAPIRVEGMFGANFPERVRGHYFWFLPANQVLNKTHGEVHGTIEQNSTVHVHTEIGEAEPIE